MRTGIMRSGSWASSPGCLPEQTLQKDAGLRMCRTIAVKSGIAEGQSSMTGWRNRRPKPSGISSGWKKITVLRMWSREQRRTDRSGVIRSGRCPCPLPCSMRIRSGRWWRRCLRNSIHLTDFARLTRKMQSSVRFTEGMYSKEILPTTRELYGHIRWARTIWRI